MKGSSACGRGSPRRHPWWQASGSSLSGHRSMHSWPPPQASSAAQTCVSSQQASSRQRPQSSCGAWGSPQRSTVSGPDEASPSAWLPAKSSGSTM